VRNVLSPEYKESIRSVIIPNDIATKRQMGHAFVHFLEKAAAVQAKRRLEGARLEGKMLHVEWALPREGKEKERERKKELLKMKADGLNVDALFDDTFQSSGPFSGPRRVRRDGKANRYELENQCFCGCLKCFGPEGELCGCSCLCGCNGSDPSDPYIGIFAIVIVVIV
jgi:RNA recognition motif-containing protein